MFGTRTDVMMHRKQEHANTVQSCIRFLTQSCSNTAESCWFKHEDKVSDKSKKKENDQSVFQEAPNNLKNP